jgi:hypothetical protein
MTRQMVSDPEVLGRAIGPRRSAGQLRVWIVVWAFMAFLTLIQGCSTPMRLAAVPKEQEAAAVVGGMTGIRYWQKGDLAVMQEDALDAYMREAELLAAAGHKGPLPPANTSPFPAVGRMAPLAPGSWLAGPPPAPGRSSSSSPASAREH